MAFTPSETEQKIGHGQGVQVNMIPIMPQFCNRCWHLQADLQIHLRDVAPTLVTASAHKQQSSIVNLVGLILLNPHQCWRHKIWRG
jgi:hypothetical protein